jgi:hypothetical protein
MIQYFGLKLTNPSMKIDHLLLLSLFVLVPAAGSYWQLVKVGARTQNKKEGRMLTMS